MCATPDRVAATAIASAAVQSGDGEQLAGVGLPRIAVGEAGQHAGELTDAVLALHGPDVGGGDPRPDIGRLVYDEVGGGERGDLGEVGDDDDLVIPRQAGQAAADLPRGLTADPGVHLVEDHHGHRVGT